jgi:4-hydroxybenzoate polyprenyltransferase
MSWLHLIRIHQWPKNLFVLAGLLFGARWQQGGALLHALETLALFCLASSLVYIFNDLHDLERDRAHPRKQRRPLASGAISPLQARVALAAGALLLLLLVWLWQPAATPMLALYLLLNLGYSLGLKTVPILDLFIICAGFVLRVLAGTRAAEVPASGWILLCTGALAFFLAVAKRRGDVPDAGSGATPTLRGYTPAFLDQLLLLGAGWTILFYGLYCSELNQALAARHNFLWTLPFVLYGVLHYLRLVQVRAGEGRSLLLDWPLALTVAGWLCTCWILLR